MKLKIAPGGTVSYWQSDVLFQITNTKTKTVFFTTTTEQGKRGVRRYVKVSDFP